MLTYCISTIKLQNICESTNFYNIFLIPNLRIVSIFHLKNCILRDFMNGLHAVVDIFYMI